MRTARLATFAAGIIAVVAGTTFAQSTQPSQSPLDRNKTRLTPSKPRPTSTAPKPIDRTTKSRPDAKTPLDRRNTPRPDPDSALDRRPTPRPDPDSALDRRLINLNPNAQNERVSPFALEMIEREAYSGETGAQRAARLNAGGDLQFDFQNGEATVSPVFTRSGLPNSRTAFMRVVDARRNGRQIDSNEDLQNVVRGNSMNLDEARAKYRAEGFDEVRMSNDEVVFVKTSSPCARQNAIDALQGTVSEDMYRNWREEWDEYYKRRGSWVYSDSFGRQSTCAGGACGTSPPPTTISPTFALDAFVLRGTLRPETPLSDREVAEIDMTEVELGVSALQNAEPAVAIEHFETYLKQYPEDASVIRTYAVALLQTSKFADGVAKLADAYRLDPLLASEPIDMALFAEGERDVTTLLQRVVPLAHRSKDADAALAAAALMQAQGRAKEAARMLQRADERGLDDAISREFSLALAPAPAAAPSPIR